MNATSTLEQIDWETVLDDSPVCESRHRCDQAATWRRYSLRCHCVHLLCDDHRRANESHVARFLYPCIIWCRYCGNEAHCDEPTQLYRWETL